MAVFAVAAFAGCGGGSNTTASGEPPLSKAAFVKQADAICEKGHKTVRTQLAAYQKEIGKAEGPMTRQDEEAALETIIIPSLQEQAQGIDELGAPKGNEQTVALLVKAIEEVAAEGEASPLEILGEKAWANVSSAAKQLGLRVCSRAF